MPEVCNGLNDDCDGNTDETLTVTCYRDDDNDSYPAAGAPERAECPDPGRLDFGQCPLGTTNRPPV
ncbi:MAG: hypothetical protein GWO04_24565, partial [Actinobacteria bacterium]|nr:hypothetical protein [Actinomycetota bacterium]